MSISFTELDVLKATRTWFRDPSHFTVEDYHEKGSVTDPDYLKQVTSTCAIGGIEHSIFKLATKNGVDSLVDFEGDRYREDLAYRTTPLKRIPKAPAYLVVYSQAMARCNVIANDLYGKELRDPDYPSWRASFEDLTLTDNWSIDMRLAAVRRVLNKAIRDAQAEAVPA